MLWDNDPIELFLKGGFAMWPLLACSFIGLSLVLERSAVLLSVRVNFDALVARLRPLVSRGQLSLARQMLHKYRSPVARIAEDYLDHVSDSADLREKVLTYQASRQVTRLERRMSWLSMIASISTLLGLLGTVTGLVSAFHQIEVKAGNVQPGDLAAGIWEALITTVFGLVIAIPCMAFYHFLENRAGAVALQMEWIVLQLDQWTHEAPIEVMPASKQDSAVGNGQQVRSPSRERQP